MAELYRPLQKKWLDKPTFDVRAETPLLKLRVRECKIEGDRNVRTGPFTSKFDHYFACSGGGSTGRLRRLDHALTE